MLTSILAFHPGAQRVRALWPAETRGPLAFRGTISGMGPGNLHLAALPDWHVG